MIRLRFSVFPELKRTVFYCLFLALLSSYVGAEPISSLKQPELNNPAEVKLGKLLFNDVRLSKDNTISCATCHNISQGGDDNRTTSLGINGQMGPINAPTVLNSGLNIAQFWDGRAKTLEEQVEGPIHNLLEMGSNWEEVIRKLSVDSQLVAQFMAVYEQEINAENISSAIAEYERQLVTVNSPFDQFLEGNDSALSSEEKEGYFLFKDLGCTACHQGRNVGGNMFQYFGLMGDYFQDRGNITDADFGRYNHTGKEEDRYKFKVPSLRNVAQTSPYFHDGSAENLDDAIKIMARYQLGRPISQKQVDLISTFLSSLTGRVSEDLK